MKTAKPKGVRPTPKKMSLSKPWMALIALAIVMAGCLIYLAAVSNQGAGPLPTIQKKMPGKLSAQVPPAPTIYLSPRSHTFKTGSTIVLEVRENSAAAPVNAVQANFSYPADKLRLIKVDTSGSAFKLEAQNAAANGQVLLARGTCAGCAALTGDRLVAKVTFSVIGAGTANLPFTSGTALATSTDNKNLIPSLSMTGGGNFTIQ